MKQLLGFFDCLSDQIRRGHLCKGAALDCLRYIPLFTANLDGGGLE